MLHYCVTGEKLARSDIQFQHRQSDTKGSRPSKQSEANSDRHQTYMAEQAMLRTIRDGSLYDQSAFDRASQLSNGIQVAGCDPLLQALLTAASAASGRPSH